MFSAHRRLLGRASFVMAIGLTANAQIPDTFTNLQVLPPDISKPELISTMRGFALSLDVRCEHCHVGEEGKGLESIRFPADDRETKRVARVMIAMTANINETLKSKIGRDPGDLLEVTCFTCHHAATHPQTLEDALQEVYAGSGAGAAIGRYKELRAKYYGRAVFDFTEQALIDLAVFISRRKNDPQGAIELLKENLKQYPRSHRTFFALGRTYQAMDNKRLAILNLRRAVRLSPDNDFYQATLKRALEK